MQAFVPQWWYRHVNTIHWLELPACFRDIPTYGLRHHKPIIKVSNHMTVATIQISIHNMGGLSYIHVHINYWPGSCLAVEINSHPDKDCLSSIMVDDWECFSPVRATGRYKLGGVVLSETTLSVITIHGGSPSPVYPSTAALLTCS